MDMLSMTVQKILVEDQGVVDTYGIASESGVAIENVSVLEDEVRQFVAKLNRLEVSDLHIADVVDDFLLER